jgi:hypothetical protein
MWVRSGSTVSNLRFEFGRSLGRRAAIGLGFLRVDRCDVMRKTPGVVPPQSEAT